MRSFFFGAQIWQIANGICQKAHNFDLQSCAQWVKKNVGEIERRFFFQMLCADVYLLVDQSLVKSTLCWYAKENGQDTPDLSCQFCFKIYLLEPKWLFFRCPKWSNGWTNTSLNGNKSNKNHLNETNIHFSCHDILYSEIMFSRNFPIERLIWQLFI